jgi:hypothetical protein
MGAGESQDERRANRHRQQPKATRQLQVFYLSLDNANKAKCSPTMNWITDVNDGVQLKVWLQPRASCTEIVKVHDQWLKIKVSSPPIEGRANKDCQKLIAEKLRLSASQVVLISGKNSRQKTFLIKGLSLNQIKTLLLG